MRAQKRIPSRCGNGVKRGFVLLEVLISLTILAVTVAAVLRSFSQSLSAINRLEVETQALFFANQLMDEFEINPPMEGETEGGFGDDYADYYFIVDTQYEYPEYDLRNRHDDVEQFFPLRTIKIDIFYDDGRRKKIRALSFESAIMGFERFSPEARQQNALY